MGLSKLLVLLAVMIGVWLAVRWWRRSGLRITVERRAAARAAPPPVVDLEHDPTSGQYAPRKRERR